MSRLFFALMPDDLVRQQIAKVSAKLPLGGQKVKAINYHATLSFLGEVPADQVELLGHAAEQLRIEPFTLKLDSREWWRKTQLTCMGASHIPEQLNVLVNSLNKSLEAFGYQSDPRPFQLHVSLMRDVKKPLNHLTFKEISWLVKGFSLVESKCVSGETEYRVIQTWDFVG